MDPNPTDNFARRDYVDVRFEALEKAVSVAEKNLDRRLDGMNAIREQLREQAQTFCSKTAYESLCEKIDKLDDRLQDLERTRERLAGMASQSSVTNAQIYAFIGIVLGTISIVISVVKFL